MINTALEIETILTRLKKEEYLIRKELDNLPEGRIMRVQDHGKEHFCVVTRGGNGKLQRRVTRDDELVTRHLRKFYLTQELRALQQDLTAVSQAMKRLSSADSASIIRRLLTAHPWINDAQLTASLQPDRSKLMEWALAPYEMSSYKPEQRNKCTSFGLWVRSKGELLCAEKFHEFGQLFRYEQVVWVGSTPFAPDFTLLREDERLMYWEHMGLLSNDKYYTHQEAKLRALRSVGIKPETNLIITFEDEFGRIDMKDLEFKIKNRLMLR